MFTLGLILCLVLINITSASARVWTDQEDYSPGSTVTIFGGNDEKGLPGYVPGTLVNVTISGPHDPAYESTTCENVIVGEVGAWSCTVTLWPDPEWALGTYTYIATSVAEDGSPIEETGMYSDSRWINSATLTANGVTVSSGEQITMSPGATIAATVNVTTAQQVFPVTRYWYSTAWKIIETPINWAYLVNHPNELLSFIQSLTEWNCVDHANHTTAGTFEETFNVTAPATPATYTIFFLAYANDTCAVTVPLPSNAYWLANSILVVPVKAPGSVNINNIPSNAVYGGSFTPTFDKLGDGATSVASLTPGTCTVTSGVVSYIGAGTCTLQASIEEDTNYLAATGPQQSFTVKYQFIGFSQPVDNNGVLNSAKAGQAIPLKFRLLDYSGVPVTNLASVTVTAASLTCAAGSTTDALEEYAAGSSGLQNLGDGYYQWNWKTPTSYANSCKTLKLDLGEGAGNEHTALFQFKK